MVRILSLVLLCASGSALAPADAARVTAGHFFTGLTVVEIKLHDHVAGDGGLCGEMGPDSLDKSWLSFR